MTLPSPSDLRDVLAIACGFAAFVAAGDATAAIIAPTLRKSAVGRLGLALVLGPGIVAYCAFVANLLNAPFSRPLSITLATLAFVAFWLARRSDRRRADEALAERSNAFTKNTLCTRLCIALVVLPVVLGFLFAAVSPPYKDSLVNWSYKSKILWHDGSVYSDDFLLPDRHLYHPNYPFLVPIAEVFLYGLAGHSGDPMDRLAKGFLALPHLGIALVVLAFLLRRMDRLPALALTALLAATPHFYKADVQFRFAGSVPSGYGDPMFAAIATLVVVALLSWLETRTRGDLVLAATALGIAIFTKNEAIPFAIAIGAAFAIAICIARVRTSKWDLPDLRSIGLALLALALLALPWLLFRRTLPERDENYQQLLTLDHLRAGAWRMPLVVVFALESALAADTYGLVWVVLAIALVVRFRRLFDPRAALTFVVLLAMALVYAAVFIVTPLPIVDSLVTSIPRTFFHLTPIAVVLIGLLVADPAEDRACN